MTEPPYSWSSPSGEPTPPSYPPPPPGSIPQGYQYGQPAWLQPGVVPLRPLALGDILDGAIKVVRRYPKPTLGLSAGIALVVTFLNVLAVISLGDNSTRTWMNNRNGAYDVDGDALAGQLATAVPAALLSLLAGLVLTGALITVVGRAVQGQEATMSEVWAAVRPRIWALLGVALLSAIISAAPFAISILLAVVLSIAAGTAGIVLGVLLGIGGFVASVYLYVRLSIASPALVLEKAGVRQALRRSGVLVAGAWWRMFGILLLTMLITSVLTGVISFPLGIISLLFFGGGDGTPMLVAQQVAAGVASVLIAPFSAGVRALLYVDRRMRAEGLDVALRAAVDPG